MKFSIKTLVELMGLLALLSLVSCGKEYNQIRKIIKNTNSSNKMSLSVDPELLPYFESFMKKSDCFDKKPEFKNLDIRFVDSIVPEAGASNSIGQCVTNYSYVNFGGSPTQEIKVLRSYWRTASYASREKLMYHELGHCTLDRDHTSNHSSIMSKGANDSSDHEYEMNYQEMISELFSGQSSCELHFDASIYQ